MTLRSPHPDLRLQHLDAVDSTNRVAADAARSGAADGLVIVADVQTAGRGRQGRRWVAPPACGLTVSFLRRPRVDAADAWIWTLLAGLAAHAVAPGGAWLKWPNDLMIGERKAGGVLCELVTTGMRLDAIVVGVGLNLVDPPGGWPDAIAARATSLAALDPALAARHLSWCGHPVLVAHSDGLDRRWSASAYDDAVLRCPPLLAALLYRDFGRTADDITVVAVGRAA